jgi:hypothetical protein
MSTPVTVLNVIGENGGSSGEFFRMIEEERIGEVRFFGQTIPLGEIVFFIVLLYFRIEK